MRRRSASLARDTEQGAGRSSRPRGGGRAPPRFGNLPAPHDRAGPRGAVADRLALQEVRDVQVLLGVERDRPAARLAVGEHVGLVGPRRGSTGAPRARRRRSRTGSSSRRESRLSNWLPSPSRPGLTLSKPAATTVTRTSSPSASSTTAPKMMFASGWATRVMASAAWFTSCSVRSVGPGDRQQHALGAVDRGLEQRRADRGLRRLGRAVGARARSRCPSAPSPRPTSPTSRRRSRG